MAIISLAKFTCDRCGRVTEYQDVETAEAETLRVEIVGQKELPYITRRFLSVCHGCGVDLVHQWWRRALSKADA